MRTLQPVEVLHDGRWLAATLMATRRDADGWRGLVGYVDSLTRRAASTACWPKHGLRAAPELTQPDAQARRTPRPQAR